MKVEVQEEINNSFLALAENEFLKKRNRPGTLTGHFPFLIQSYSCFNILLKNEQGHVIGGMVLRITPDIHGHFGTVGLVVIREDYRGKNYSSQMMKQVIETAKQQQLDYLVLWTSLHDYYRQFGFVVDEPLAYLEMEEDVFTDGIADKEIQTFSSRPTYTRRLGRMCLADTAVDYVFDGYGYIFTDYSGNIDRAAKIITNKYGNAHRPRLNIVKNDPLIDRLTLLQPQLSRFPNEYEMWLKIKPAVASKTVIGFQNRI